MSKTAWWTFGGTFSLQKSRVFFEIQIGNICWGEIYSTLDEVCFGEFHRNQWNDVWPVSSVHWACLPLGDWWKMMESHWGFENDFFEQRLSDVVWDEISDLRCFLKVHRWFFFSLWSHHFWWWFNHESKKNLHWQSWPRIYRNMWTSAHI